MFTFFWYDILYQPLYNLLIFFYLLTTEKDAAKHVIDGDMGLAIIFLTLFIRLLLLPLSIRGARSEHRLEKLQPTIDEIKIRYKYDIEKQRLAIRKLLQQNHIGIFSNLLSLLFQLLFFFILYKIFSSGLQIGGHNILYQFIPTPDYIDPTFLNRFSLIEPNQGASLFAACMVFLSEAIRKVRHISDANAVDKALLFFLPVGTYLATIILPSSKAIFIATSVCFSLWIRLIKVLVVKYVVKDDELKKNIDNLWTN